MEQNHILVYIYTLRGKGFLVFLIEMIFYD